MSSIVETYQRKVKLIKRVQKWSESKYFLNASHLNKYNNKLNNLLKIFDEFNLKKISSDNISIKKQDELDNELFIIIGYSDKEKTRILTDETLQWYLEQKNVIYISDDLIYKNKISKKPLISFDYDNAITFSHQIIFSIIKYIESNEISNIHFISKQRNTDHNYFGKSNNYIDKWTNVVRTLVFNIEKYDSNKNPKNIKDRQWDWINPEILMGYNYNNIFINLIFLLKLHLYENIFDSLSIISFTLMQKIKSLKKEAEKYETLIFKTILEKSEEEFESFREVFETNNFDKGKQQKNSRKSGNFDFVKDDFYGKRKKKKIIHSSDLDNDVIQSNKKKGDV